MFSSKFFTIVQQDARTGLTGFLARCATSGAKAGRTGEAYPFFELRALCSGQSEREQASDAPTIRHRRPEMGATHETFLLILHSGLYSCVDRAVAAEPPTANTQRNPRLTTRLVGAAATRSDDSSAGSRLSDDRMI